MKKSFLAVRFLFLFLITSTLACHKAEKPAQAYGAQSLERCKASAPQRVFDDGATRTLLVVDNDDSVVQSITPWTAGFLINPVAAHSVQQGLAIARTTSLLGVMLSDALVGADAFDVVEEIRSAAHNPEMPVALMSTDHGLTAQLAATRAGATQFVEKPLLAAPFGDFMQQLLNRELATTPRVMLVDSDHAMMSQNAAALEAAGFSVAQRTDATDILDKLDEFRPDVLLLGIDVEFPPFTSLEICQTLSNSSKWNWLPIIMTGQDIDLLTRLLAFRYGASDVLSEPLYAGELIVRINAQERRNRLLRDRADKDALSGLMRRQAFEEAGSRAITTAVRDKTPISLVLIDLDNFKYINDNYGHPVGDQVLAAFGDLVRRWDFRKDDLLARWGGEEFVLAFINSGLDFAVDATQKLLANFSQIDFHKEDGSTFRVTFSAGVVERLPEETSITSMVKRADPLLYTAKQLGRNRVLATLQ